MRKLQMEVRNMFGEATQTLASHANAKRSNKCPQMRSEATNPENVADVLQMSLMLCDTPCRWSKAMACCDIFIDLELCLHLCDCTCVPKQTA